MHVAAVPLLVSDAHVVPFAGSMYQLRTVHVAGMIGTDVESASNGVICVPLHRPAGHAA